MPDAPRRSTPISPTGRQWRLGDERQELIVTEVGATMRSYRFAGQDAIDGFRPDQWAQGGRGQVLAPWPNRLGDGRYAFGGVSAQAALDEPERDNAIHGLVRWLPWRRRNRTPSSLAVGCRLHPTPGYPFVLDLCIEYRLQADGLSVTTTAFNPGEITVPFGLGFHPYVTAGASRIDSSVLRLPATEELVLDARGLPTGERRPVTGGDHDFLAGRPIGPTRLDSALTGLRRSGDGIATARLEDPVSGRSIELWVDRSFAYLMCFTGDTIAESSRRRAAMAIEPMTCPPDALRSGHDLIILGPGQRWEGAWGLRPAGR